MSSVLDRKDLWKFVDKLRKILEEGGEASINWSVKGSCLIFALDRYIEDPQNKPRFDVFVYVPLPDEAARKEIFRIHLRGKPLADDVNLDELARRTEGYSGADLRALVREAALSAMSAGRESVGPDDFELALRSVRPSITKEMLEYFSKLEQRLNSRIYSEARQPYL